VRVICGWLDAAFARVVSCAPLLLEAARSAEARGPFLMLATRACGASDLRERRPLYERDGAGVCHALLLSRSPHDP